MTDTPRQDSAARPSMRPAGLRDLIRGRAWFAVPVLGAILIAIFFALPAASTPQSAVYDIVGLGAVGVSFAALIRRRPAGWQPWLFLVAGQLAFVVGDVCWTVFDAQGLDPFPSVADAFYLAGYPLMSIGLVLAIRLRVSGGDRTGLLDAAILATGAAVIWWAFFLGPLVATADPDPLSFAISAAYPVGDLLLLGMVLALLFVPGARSPSFELLLANLVTILVADLVFGLQSLDGSYVDGGWLDGLWLVAYVLFASAATHPTMTAVAEPRPMTVTLLGPIRLALFAAAMLTGPVLLLVGETGSSAIVIVVAGATAAMSVLVLARLFAVVRQLAGDIERRAALEARLSFEASHDPLTELANRRKLVAATASALGGDAPVAMLFLDLDDFKDVNDSMGHDAGDALLVAIASRIASVVRPDDLVCRLGGDEFAVMLPGSAAGQAEAVAARVLSVFDRPVRVEGVDLSAAASVGVGMRAPGETCTTDELLRRADVAMYRAKALGKRRVATWSADLDATAIVAPTIVRSLSPAT